MALGREREGMGERWGEEEVVEEEEEALARWVERAEAGAGVGEG